MVDWLLEEGRKKGNFMPLYELLIRLRRACIKNNLVDENIDLVDFACSVYKTGLPELLPVDSVGNTGTFSDGSLGRDSITGKPGGFDATEAELMTVLYKNFFSKPGMTEPQMLERVEAMDGQAQALQEIATALQGKLHKCTTHDAVQAVMKQVRPLLAKTAGTVRKLGDSGSSSSRLALL